MRKYPTLSATALVLCFGFVACGDDNSTTADGGSDSSTDTGTPLSDATNSADTKMSNGDGQSPMDAQNRGDSSTGSDSPSDAPNPMDVSRDTATDTGSPGDGGCSAAQLHCGTACVDPATNRLHCGGCNQACTNNQTCVSGNCVRVTCDGGMTVCAGECVDTQTSNQHCGGCNMACGTGAVCTNGNCGCSNTSQVYCANSGCFDITTSTDNCGRCGNSCGSGGTCTGGMCTCATGAMMCGTGCADLMTDPNNCGMCGRMCAGGTVACVGGMCQTTACDGGACCATGFTLCPGGRAGAMPHCANLQSDAMDCGSCGNSCMGGACAAGVCM